MKTAEEWYPELGCDVSVEQIKAIQLDAWKQGMTDACQCIIPDGNPIVALHKIEKALNEKTSL